MALKQQQDLLARLYTDPDLRSRFLESPSSNAEQFGLETAEAEDLARVAADEVRWFADSLLHKRLREAAKLLPLTKRIMGHRFDKEFLKFAENFNPTSVKKHLEDAVAFFASVRIGSSDSAVADIAGWEAARLQHDASGRRFSFYLLRFDPRKVIAGENEATAERGIGFWIAFGGRSRIFFW